jgi:hypothetical protein
MWPNNAMDGDTIHFALCAPCVRVIADVGQLHRLGK